MSSDASFWDKASKKYAASPIRDMDSYEYTLDRTRSYLAADDTVLELGCGTGSTAVLLAGSVHSYVGTDVSDGMIKFARDKAWEASIEGLSFDVAGAAEALRGANPKTRILAFNLFHLIRDVPGTLKMAHAALEPGGLLISKTPCLKSGGLGIRAIVSLAIPLMQMIGKAPFVHSLTVSELDRMIEDAGFEIVEVGNYPANPPSRYVVARKL